MALFYCIKVINMVIYKCEIDTYFYWCKPSYFVIKKKTFIANYDSYTGKM